MKKDKEEFDEDDEFDDVVEDEDEEIEKPKTKKPKKYQEEVEEEIEEERQKEFDTAKGRTETPKKTEPRFVAFRTPAREGILDRETNIAIDDLFQILAEIKNDLQKIKENVA